MIVKTITFKDFNDDTVTDDFYFNLTRSEMLMYDASIPGGLAGAMEYIRATRDGKKLIGMFEDLIKRSYGIKSPDGRRFIKSDEVYQEFAQSNAYDELIIEFITDPNKAGEFFHGLCDAIRDSDDRGADGEHKTLQVVTSE